jgi:uncharacterized protein with FMN-binding domain
MDKSTLLVSAIVLAVFGTSVTAGHPSWGIFTGIAIILLAAGLAAGALPMRSDDYFEERIGAGQRISKSLVTLSSTAIVAIYAAGYHRTSPAAHKFDSQTEQARTAAEATAAVLPPPANPASAAASPAGSPSPAPAVRKNNIQRPAVASPKAGSAPTESSESPATPPVPTSGTGANPAAGAAAANAQSSYKDGLFLGWGSCRHGDIEASVLIQGGKIVTAAITQCLTRYSCTWISPRVPSPVLPDLPREVVERQSAKVDYVSGATESSYAFADAIIAALSKASE